MKLSLLLVLAFAVPAFAGVEAPPLPDAAPAAKQGLTLTFTTPDGKNDARDSRLLALFVPGDQAPTPFLPTGPFTAKWTGAIVSPLRAEYTFKTESSAGFKLSINGADVPNGGSVKLNKGANELVAELPRAATGDTFVRLNWVGRDFPTEPVPPTVFSHDANAKDLRAGDRLREGRMLFAQLRCTACHEANSVLPAKGEGMPELAQDAPVFDELGARYQEAWLAHWINDPKSIRPHALMPKVFASPPGDVAQEAADLAAYFATLGKPAEGKPVDESLAGEGGALFANLGCVACHQKPDADGPDEHDRLPLSHVKAKWQPAALAEWLKDPAKNYRSNRMPHFRLSDDETQRLVAYLLTTANREFPAPPKGDAAKGAPLLVASGCLNCHAGIPPMTTPPLAKTLEAGWKTGCLATDPAGRGKAPDFAFTPVEHDALAAFASSGLASLKQDAPAEYAERQIKNLRCVACHSSDGAPSILSSLEDETAPLQAAAPLEEGEGKPVFTTALPLLTWFGEKLKPEWMARFIAGKHEGSLRPWDINRMPGFACAAEALPQGLAYQHGFPLADEPQKADSELARAGETLLGENGGFACTTCHAVGEKAATAVFEAPGINFAFTADRLRRAYYVHWVTFPARIDPDTKMPRFADDEGKTPLTDFFDGQATGQFDAIWQFLQTLKK